MGARPGTNRGRSGSLGGDLRGTQGHTWKAMLGGLGSGGGGITGWQDGSGIGSGLLMPGVHGSCLRRKVNEPDLEDSTSSTGAGNTKLSELIPRFIRLSALVAAELAIEAREEEDASSVRSREGMTDQYARNDGDWTQMQSQRDHGGSFSPPSSPSTIRATFHSQDKMFDVALRPTREWFMLLAGLLTRAVLEGYLTAGWRGLQPVECLLTVGLGVDGHIDPEEEPKTGFEEFDPDGLPTLLEAAMLLFPTSKNSTPPRKGQAEEEYEAEMYERLRKVNFPHSIYLFGSNMFVVL